MERTIDTKILEDRIDLCVFFGEGIAHDAVVFKQLLDIHDDGNRSIAVFPSLTSSTSLR